MGRRSSIEDHPQRDEIEKALYSGGTYREISNKYGVSKSAIERYKREKVPKAVQVAKQTAVAETGQSILDEVRKLRSVCDKIITETMESGRQHITIQAIDKFAKLLELQAKLEGQLSEGDIQIAIVMPERPEPRRVNEGDVIKHPKTSITEGDE